MFTMPSKKRKYNARFPAGRIKKIMQTDEEVGKVAQAVPIIISTPRTLELFVESLLSKAMQVTLSRNAKTLSPSHVKQCILAESRFDFLKDLVKTIPDVSAAEEKELMSAESSPNSSRFSDTSCPPPRKVLREDSSSSSGSDVRTQGTQTSRLTNDDITPKNQNPNKPETVTSVATAIDLTKKQTEEKKIVTANFYQETLTLTDDSPSVIQLNPTRTTPQPSTSTTMIAQNNSLPLKPIPLLTPVPKSMKPPVFHIDLSTMNNNAVKPHVTPIINIDFSKNFAQPEIRVLDTPVPNLLPIKTGSNSHLRRQISDVTEVRKIENKVSTFDDNLNSGNLEIDEDYDT